MFRKTRGDLVVEVRQLKSEIVGLREAFAEKTEELNSLKEIKKLNADKDKLNTEVSQLREEKEKEKRTIEHMVGLERERQKFEVDQAKREAVLEVKESNLTAERKQFDDQMKFKEESFNKQMTRIDGILNSVLDRLPTVTVDRHISDKTITRSEANSDEGK